MLTLAEAAQCTGGEWISQPLPPQTPLRGGAFDTRDLGQAQIFFALAGEGAGADGHDHLPKLAGTGIQLAVVSRAVEIPGFAGAVLRVPDTLAAMAHMARHVVQKHAPRVVAVTGSFGKTTAKEEIAWVLSGAEWGPDAVLKSPGSHNNEIGIPITLLGLGPEHTVCVLEYSARKEGDIAYLCGIAPPDVALLLAVGHAHIGVFGGLEQIYRAKGEIFTHMAPGGLALAGSADPRLRTLAGSARVQTFGPTAGHTAGEGTGENAGEIAVDFAAEEITLDGEGRQVFTGVCAADGTRLPLRASLPGPHGCEPVLAAWAVARALGLPDDVVTNRAGGAPAQKGRLRVLKASGGAALLDDCYNASPETIINLIQTLKARPERDKVLVLGPLAELEEGLGETARRIAAALTAPLGRCIMHDPRSDALYRQVLEHLPSGAPEMAFTASQTDLVANLKGLDAPGRVVGIKGARSAHMERAVAALQGTHVACTRHPCPWLRYCTDCDRLGQG